MRLFILITIVGLFLACTGPKPPIIQEVVEPQTILTVAMADSFWSLRADTAFANRALQAYQKLAEADSTSITVWSKLSQAYHYHGQYLNTNSALRDSLFMRGYEVSQAILNQNNQYRDLLFSSGDESIAIRGLTRESIDALYWGMANYGQWLSTKGSLVRLGQRDLHWATLEHIRDLDSTYYFGAYYRYKGPLLARDPATQRDTLAILQAFQTAIKIAPDYLGNYTLMATYYCPVTQDKDLFYQLLTKVITSPLDQTLSYHPENMYERKLAERLMIKAEKENWFKL